MSSSIYEIDGNPIVDEKTRSKITDIKNVAKSGSYKDLDLTGATINTNYNLPNSSDTILGGVKIGENLSITNRGVLSTPIIDESLHKTSIQLTKDRKQIININDGDTIILPDVSEEELLTIDVEIHIPWNIEHKSPSVTFPTDIKWVESPRLKYDSWYNYRFIYAKDQWLGGFTEFDVVYDSSMNIFVMDTTMTPGDKTVKLQKDRAGDTTNWDGVTDWGDGTIDNTTSHTYENDGIYLVKTKYKLEISGNYGNSNNTKPKMIDCLNINKHMTNLYNLFGNTSITNIDLSSSNTSAVTDMNSMFARCSKLQSITGLENFNTSNVTNMSNMFQGCKNLTTLDVSNFNTTNVTNMSNMFQECYSLTTLDLSNFDTSNVTNMSWMFDRCSKVTILDVSNWNTSNVTTFGHGLYSYGGLFNGCSKLTKIIGIEDWDVSKVTQCGAAFRGCSSITELDLSKWNTENCTEMLNMFGWCSSLTTLDVSNFDTSNVTNMRYMFFGCNKLTTLDVSNFNTNNVTDMGNMFDRCGSLTALDLTNFNTSKVTNMNRTFYNCSSLTTLDVSNFDTSNVTNMGEIFVNCSSLTTLDVSNFNTSKVTNMNGIFNGCLKLTNIDLSNWITSSLTSGDWMFTNCQSIISLNLSGFDVSKVTNLNKTFYNCKSLTTLDISNFNMDNVTTYENMFYNCTSLHQSGLTMTNCNEATKNKILELIPA